MITATGACQNCRYWLDIGNYADSGQFVLGQPENSKNQKLQYRLPTVAELYPEIVDSKLDRKDKLPPCSAVEAVHRQESFINETCQSVSAVGDFAMYACLQSPEILTRYTAVHSDRLLQALVAVVSWWEVGVEA